MDVKDRDSHMAVALFDLGALTSSTGFAELAINPVSNGDYKQTLHQQL